MATLGISLTHSCVQEAIFADVADRTDKSEKEVEEYYNVFWKRYKEMSDWDKIVARIEKGEQRIVRQAKNAELLHRKVSGFADPLNTLRLNYGGTK